MAAKAGGLYSYGLVSLWNLNEKQGIQTEFHRWAWAQLASQDEQFSRGDPPGKTGYDWKPVYRFENNQGRQVLRYMKADPASAPACVSCHNNYEQRPEVIAVRNSQGVAAGRTWKLHQLMGGVEVEIPVDQVAAAAAAGRNKMLAGLGSVFLIGFGLLFGLIYTTIINPVETSVREVEGFSQRVDSVVGCSKKLLLGAEDQIKSCQDAQSLAAGNAQFADSLQGLSRAANENAKSAEESAVHCNQLDESFGHLKGRLLKILGSS